jgi:hypothetical protein
MKLRNRILLAGASVALGLGAASAANAATFINAPSAGVPNGDFGNTDPASAFSDVYTFSLTGPGFLTATIQSVYATIDQNVNFYVNGVKLNNKNFTIVSRGNPELLTITQRVYQGTQTIQVAGQSQPNGTYSGTLAFAAGGVPEPTTWALMILGFGVVGFAMRNKKAAAAGTKLRYA